MQFSEQWLREWVNPPISREKLTEQLTMAGLEVESITPALDDFSIEVNLTPNRGDCLSIAGIAREVAVINRCAMTAIKSDPIAHTIPDKFQVTIKEPSACPRYIGRVIRGINPKATTPQWMQDRLQRSGMQCISPVVDVTNYVMLEMGQPLHAFDLAKLKGSLQVRFAKQGELLTLLDGREVTLDAETLVIADEKNAQAIAGIMGGADSAVSDTTHDIFLESAFFNPLIIAGKARRYNLSTDSSHRFERGVDPNLAIKASERAAALLLEIVGGKAGPVIAVETPAQLPTLAVIQLRRQRIKRVLGIDLPDATIVDILTRLGMQVVNNNEGWQVTVPSYRFDVAIEVDLIEELARIYGYQQIPEHLPASTMVFKSHSESALTTERLRHVLIDRGYNEAITYSFTDAHLQKLVDPEQSPLVLANPLSAELAVMRTNLWPGLLTALLYNVNRQQARVRLFETGLRYIADKNAIQQQPMLAGVVTGSIYPEQWGLKSRATDFFDIKGDLQALFALTGQLNDFTFSESHHAALHPGQSSQILRNGKAIGHAGALNPTIQHALDITEPVFLFELALDALTGAILPAFESLSKFPSIRRDIAFIVVEKVSAQQILTLVHDTAGELLKNLQLFDVYQGVGIEAGHKSVALGLILQHPTRTLIDDEVNEVVSRVITALQREFNVILRD